MSVKKHFFLWKMWNMPTPWTKATPKMPLSPCHLRSTWVTTKDSLIIFLQDPILEPYFMMGHDVEGQRLGFDEFSLEHQAISFLNCLIMVDQSCLR
jgi:hypothetical protein